MTDYAVLTKIAKLELAGLPQVEIARVCGVSEGRISQVMSSDIYKDQKKEITTKDIVARHLSESAKGWDSLEEDSVAILMSHLENDRVDPEFVLKVASISNKAIRRNTDGTVRGGNGSNGGVNGVWTDSSGIQHYGDNPNGVNGSGERVTVISMNTNYVQNVLNNNYTIKDSEKARKEHLINEGGGLRSQVDENGDVIAHKYKDMMDISTAQRLLSPAKAENASMMNGIVNDDIAIKQPSALGSGIDKFSQASRRDLETYAEQFQEVFEPEPAVAQRVFGDNMFVGSRISTHQQSDDYFDPTIDSSTFDS